jgi:hypothetical protein
VDLNGIYRDQWYRGAATRDEADAFTAKPDYSTVDPVYLAKQTATVPSAPQSVIAIAGDRAVTIGWEAPDNGGGSSITGYEVTQESAGTVCAHVPGTTTTCQVTGLTNGTSYVFHVRARNAVGYGPAAASSPVTPTSPDPVIPQPPVRLGQTVSLPRGSLKIKRKLTLAKRSSGAISVRWKTLTPKTCKISKGKLVGVKAGTCRVRGYAAGTSSLVAVTATGRIKIRR